VKPLSNGDSVEGVREEKCGVARLKRKLAAETLQSEEGSGILKAAAA